MRKYILIAVLLAPASALSQEGRTYTLTVTPQELTTIAQALGERPYREAAPLLKRLDEQLKAQEKPAEPAKEPEPVK